jgi:hypothetical protein
MLLSIYVESVNVKAPPYVIAPGKKQASKQTKKQTNKQINKQEQAQMHGSTQVIAPPSLQNLSKQLVLATFATSSGHP